MKERRAQLNQEPMEHHFFRRGQRQLYIIICYVKFRKRTYVRQTLVRQTLVRQKRNLRNIVKSVFSV